MPQLDIYSYFSVATTLIISFLFLLFVLHNYLLPKVSQTLKFRKKYIMSGDDLLLMEFTDETLKKPMKDADKPISKLAGVLSDVNEIGLGALLGEFNTLDVRAMLIFGLAMEPILRKPPVSWNKYDQNDYIKNSTDNRKNTKSVA